VRDPEELVLTTNETSASKLEEEREIDNIYSAITATPFCRDFLPTKPSIASVLSIIEKLAEVTRKNILSKKDTTEHETPICF